MSDNPTNIDTIAKLLQSINPSRFNKVDIVSLLHDNCNANTTHKQLQYIESYITELTKRAMIAEQRLEYLHRFSGIGEEQLTKKIECRLEYESRQ